MSPALPQPTRSHQTDRSVRALSGRPSTRNLLGWGALVLTLHLALLLSLAGSLDWSLSSPQTLRTGPMQTRTITAPADTNPATTTAAKPTPDARTRVALVEKPPLQTVPEPAPAPTPRTELPEQPVSPKTKPRLDGRDTPPTATANQAIQPLLPGTASAKAPNTASSTEATPSVPNANTVISAPPPEKLAPNSGVSDQTLGTDSHTNSRTEPSSAETQTNTPPANQPPSTALASPPTTQTLPAPASEPNPRTSPQLATAEPATPDRTASATLNLPSLDLASLPASALLSYRLTGQEKGLTYQATGELRWQRNASAYAMSLSVRAFLLGTRQWRSTGQIGPAGLSPTRFSDSWRSERAAHFDRPNQRIVFSSNAPSVALQPGAQDQVSLYVQLAAAMAQSDERMPAGTRLQIQTATVRDALPWLLTLEKWEPVVIDGQSLPAVKWVCQPRNNFDARVEIWVSAAHDWLPARIRITQVNGSFIDLQLTGRERLAELTTTP